MPSASHTLLIPETCVGLRLDQALAELFPDYSRSRLQNWIKTGMVTLDGRQPRAKEKVAGGETVTLTAHFEDVVDDAPQEIPLEIVHEDEDLLIVNKPAGLVVHPAAGHRDGTLVNALLHHAPELARLPRSGIVHRIDKDTSGLLMVARSIPAHKILVERLQARKIEREYLAIAHGRMTAGGTVDAPIGRHPTDRKRFAVREGGREAVTHYRVVERFALHTLLRLKLETGRTHQIRVHLAHIRHPLVGDPAYGGRPRLPAGASAELVETLQAFRRQALHAARLGLAHPATGELMAWEAPLPEDMEHLLAVLRNGAE
ncbi:MAG TPA: 23S rRNA pseudouridine(1911/1915/1917) synthase RluD [Methylococcaceae bacterium]|nr:23S rRNA pseudouridine(1911/1915/1917) synthase RluD [Methylococcaceae bacterium]